MADDMEDMTETNIRGADWEVISLTASTYAAAPSPQYFDPFVQLKQKECNKAEQECSEPMVMSKHFVITEAYQAKNDVSTIYKDQSILDEKFIKPKKPNKIKCKFNSSNDLHGNENEGKGLKSVEKGLHFFISSSYDSFADEDFSLPAIHDGIFETSPRAVSCKRADENNDERDDGFCESWWKMQALSVYNHAKGTNPLWSVFVALAVAGVFFLGQRLWWREKPHILQFKWKFSSTGEKTRMMAKPASRFRVPIGGNQCTVG